MPALTIEVPTEHRDDLLRVLLHLYAVSTDALHHATNDYLNNERALDPLLAHRTELAAIDALVDQLGWRLHVAGSPARLVGEAHLLSEIAHSALDTAVNDLCASLSEADSGLDRVAEIARSLARANALFHLLEAVHGTGAERES